MFEFYNVLNREQMFDYFVSTEGYIMARKAHRSRKKRYYPRRIAAAVLLIGYLITLFTAETANADGAYEGGRYKYYTSVYVSQGDSLWSIASDYWTKEYPDVSSYIEEIKQLNQISSDTIKSGTYLCIPYYSGKLQR